MPNPGTSRSNGISTDILHNERNGSSIHVDGVNAGTDGGYPVSTLSAYRVKTKWIMLGQGPSGQNVESHATAMAGTEQPSTSTKSTGN